MKIIKQILFLPVCAGFLISCSSGNIYKPKYQEYWGEINDSIRHNWVNASGVCAPSLKDSFAYAFWCGLQFYWDTYYSQIGLLAHNQVRIAKGGANNLLHLADSLGFVPNANMDWGDNRSQPPYLSQIVRDLYPHLNDTSWLRNAYRILLKEYSFWTDTSPNAIEKHSTSVPGLQRFFNHATKRELIELYTKELIKRFNLKADIDTAQMLAIAANYATEAATGMDFTTRFEHRCADFIAVDLNSNLYIYEKNFAWMEQTLGVSDGKAWENMAMQRKDLINKYCWDEKRGLYLDYDYVNHRASKVAAATTFSPLYAGIASKEQAKQVVSELSLLESEWGIITTEEVNEPGHYQWDHISVWPPMQALVFMALKKYGFYDDARRVGMKYMDLVAKNYLKPYPSFFIKNKNDTVHRTKGQIYEKYTRHGEINDREYNASYMMNWSAGAFAYIYSKIND